MDVRSGSSSRLAQPHNGSIPYADAGDEAGEFGDSAWSIAHCHDEPTQPTVSGQASIETAAEHRRVNITATQWNHNPTQPTKVQHWPLTCESVSMETRILTENMQFCGKHGLTNKLQK